MDGFRVADEVFARSREAFWFFAETKLGFHCIHAGVNTLTYAPVFELDSALASHIEHYKEAADERPPIVRFRYNNDDRSTLNHLDSETVDNFYRHLPLLLDVMRCDDLILKKRLHKGDWVITNNHRVLHGRKAFSGTGRLLIGCYAELDEVDWKDPVSE